MENLVQPANIESVEEIDMYSYAGTADVLDDVYETDPVKMLYLSILESALNDLKSADVLLKSNAVQWFTSDKSWLPAGVSYVDVIDNYPLRPRHAKQIKEALFKARFILCP